MIALFNESDTSSQQGHRWLGGPAAHNQNDLRFSQNEKKNFSGSSYPFPIAVVLSFSRGEKCIIKFCTPRQKFLAMALAHIGCCRPQSDFAVVVYDDGHIQQC